MLVDAELLALMDLNMREMYREDARATPGGWVIDRNGLVLCGSPLGLVTTNMAIVAGPTDVEAIRAETSIYQRTGLPFSVWTCAHGDRSLEADLVRAGFVHIHSEPGMVLASEDAAPVPVPPAIEIRAVSDDAGREAYTEVIAESFAVYDAPRESTRSHFVKLRAVTGPTTQAFLAYAGGRAVAGALLYMSHGVGGIGWVGTRPEERGHGYGRAVTAAVAREGFRRGARFMNLQASPMGAPMYRRMGFSVPTEYHVWIASE